MSLLQRHLTLILLLTGLVSMAAVLTQFGPRTLETVEQEAEIVFTAEPGMVILPGNCVLASWQVGNIQTIFINGEPTTGANRQTICIDTTTRPTLTITFQDGTTQDIALDVPILILHPLFLLGVALWGGALYRVMLSNHGKTRVPALPRFLQRALPVLLGFLLPVLALEMGLRWYFTNNGTQEERIMYVMSVDEIRALDSVLVPMSYMNYAPSPYYPEHNRLGYRGETVELPKPDGVYRIVALGGSTTYSTGTTPENAYPAQLERILHDDYGYTHVDVVNAGFIGYSTWETLTNLAFRVLEIEPDMVIHYAAINDLAPREQISTDCYRGENILRGINAARGFWIERDDALSSSVLHRFLGINLGLMPNPLALRSTFELPNGNCEGDGGLPIEERVEQNAPVYFERNLRSLIGIAQVHEVDVVFSTWAYYTEAERPDYWRDAIAQHNDLTRAVGNELDAPVIDLAASLPVNGDFWEADGIHMVATGAEEQASLYARYLVENALIPPP